MFVVKGINYINIVVNVFELVLVFMFINSKKLCGMDYKL